MKHIYGELKMSWLTVVLFAIITGVYTGSVMLIPCLNGTSFQDIGVTHEWWVIFAVIVVVNCKKSWEAMLKCFAFFLISQPAVFLTEIVFGSLETDMALYYLRLWMPMIILTLPGGFIAYFCKKQNLIGSIILGIGNTIQAMLGVHYFGSMLKNFPNHLLTSIVCFGSILVMSIWIQKERKYRLISIIFSMVAATLILLALKSAGRTLF